MKLNVQHAVRSLGCVLQVIRNKSQINSNLLQNKT